MNDTTSSPGFFNVRNEKAQKLFGWLAIGGVGLTIWNWILPWVLMTLVGTLKVVAIGAILAVFAIMVLDPKFRWSIGFLTQRIVGLFASLIVNTDPIGVMKYRLKEAKAMLQELLSSIAELRGAVDKAFRDRDIYQQEQDKAEGRLIAAQKRGGPNGAMIATEANIANRRRRSIESINREIAQGENMVKLLERYAEQSEAYVRDMADNISFTERERKRLKTAFSAFKAASNILKGKSVGAEMYEEALDRANQDAAMMIGEMKQFISESRGALEGFELDKEGAVEQALKNIEAKSQGSLMLEFQPGLGLPITGTQKVPVPATASDDIDRFLNSH
jgi:hypothetical protein